MIKVIYNNKQNNYTIDIPNFNYKTEVHSLNLMNEWIKLGLDEQELKLALDYMFDYDHDEAEFGTAGGFLFTK